MTRAGTTTRRRSLRTAAQGRMAAPSRSHRSATGPSTATVRAATTKLLRGVSCPTPGASLTPCAQPLLRHHHHRPLNQLPQLGVSLPLWPCLDALSCLVFAGHRSATARRAAPARPGLAPSSAAPTAWLTRTASWRGSSAAAATSSTLTRSCPSRRGTTRALGSRRSCRDDDAGPLDRPAGFLARWRARLALLKQPPLYPSGRAWAQRLALA